MTNEPDYKLSRGFQFGLATPEDVAKLTEKGYVVVSGKENVQRGGYIEIAFPPMFTIEEAE
jgi:hypothetical protein